MTKFDHNDAYSLGVLSCSVGAWTPAEQGHVLNIAERAVRALQEARTDLASAQARLTRLLAERTHESGATP